MSAQSISIIGLILNVVGSILFIADTNRLSSLLAGMVKHIAEDHGKYDSRHFKKEEINNLQNKINSSKSLSWWGYSFFLIGFLLQLVSNFF